VVVASKKRNLTPCPLPIDGEGEERVPCREWVGVRFPAEVGHKAPRRDDPHGEWRDDAGAGAAEEGTVRGTVVAAGSDTAEGVPLLTEHSGHFKLTTHPLDDPPEGGQEVIIPAFDPG
jgi:hypothetical protein